MPSVSYLLSLSFLVSSGVCRWTPPPTSGSCSTSWSPAASPAGRRSSLCSTYCPARLQRTRKKRKKKRKRLELCSDTWQCDCVEMKRCLTELEGPLVRPLRGEVVFVFVRGRRRQSGTTRLLRFLRHRRHSRLIFAVTAVTWRTEEERGFKKLCDDTVHVLFSGLPCESTQSPQLVLDAAAEVLTCTEHVVILHQSQHLCSGSWYI